MLLCDSAQAVNNKLYVLGGGWDVIGPGSPSAIALKLDVPWDKTNQKHHFELTLEDADGQPVGVAVPPDDAIGLIKIEGDVEVGRPVGVPEGTPLSTCNLGPLPLAPGRYVWKLVINGLADWNWQLPFAVHGLQFARST